jgi:hypothetical protein
MNIIRIYKNVSKDEAARILGLKVYDTALPQGWLDDILLKLAASPSGRLGILPKDICDIVVSGTVWCYDGGMLWGFPYALTERAYDWLNRVESFQSNQSSVLRLP